MFDLAEKRLAWIPIQWKGVQAGPEGELASPVQHEIECHVELVDTERMREIFTPEEGAEPLSELEKFKALVSDWRKVKANGASAPMTDENIRIMLRMPMFAAGFEASYLAAWTGSLEMREKNSEGSPGAGRAAKPSAPAKAKQA